MFHEGVHAYHYASTENKAVATYVKARSAESSRKKCRHPFLSPPGSLFRETSATSAFAERMRIALAVIVHVQVVLEKLAGQHGGERRRRQAITYLETLKALSRLLLLACTREMVTGGGVVSTIL